MKRLLRKNGHSRKVRRASGYTGAVDNTTAAKRTRWAMLLMGLMLQPATNALAQCDDRFPELTPTRDFTFYANGTALHAKTGLIWSRCSMGQVWKDGACAGTATKHDFTGAFEQAKQANTAHYLGFSTWRLPTYEELQAILEFHCSNPTINEGVFPNTPSSWYWSASSYSEFPHYGQPVDFGNGTDDIFFKITYEAHPFPVRLVRNGEPLTQQALALDNDDDGVNDALEIAQGMDPQLKDNDITRDDRFIAQLHRDLYRREATATELAGQLQRLNTHPNRVERLVDLAIAPEYQQQHLEIIIMMQLLINNQIATRESLTAWRDALQKGGSVIALMDDAMQKSELKGV
jgi:hypothetical protein